jgi:N6-L-threonylcarbamoyladenine synthase
MIAYAGAQRLAAGQVDGESVQVRPRWPMTELPPIRPLQSSERL